MRRLCILGMAVVAAAAVVVSMSALTGASAQVGERPPVAQDDYLSTGFGFGHHRLDVLANDSDPDGDLVARIRIIEGPSQGNVVGPTAAYIHYHAPTNFSSEDQLTYEVCDTGGRCDTATLYVTVHIPDPPQTQDDYPPVIQASLTSTVRGEIDILANDVFDRAYASRSPIEIVDHPRNANVARKLGDSGTLQYTVFSTFGGQDSFSYRVCLHTLACSTSTVHLRVQHPSGFTSPILDQGHHGTVQRSPDGFYHYDIRQAVRSAEQPIDYESLDVWQRGDDRRWHIEETGPLVAWSVEPDVPGPVRLGFQLCDTAGLCSQGEIQLDLQLRPESTVPQPEPGSGIDSEPAPPADQRCTIRGTVGDDRLIGTAGPDVICGYDGDDVLIGLGGDDILIGGPGADRLKGGPGNDTLKGEAGRDKLRGNTGNDTLKGGDGPDHLNGGQGRDILRGNQGKDRLLGGKGRDILRGGRGTDRLRGGPGKDQLKGGKGNDYCGGPPNRTRRCR